MLHYLNAGSGVLIQGETKGYNDHVHVTIKYVDNVAYLYTQFFFGIVLNEEGFRHHAMAFQPQMNCSLITPIQVTTVSPLQVSLYNDDSVYCVYATDNYFSMPQDFDAENNFFTIAGGTHSQLTATADGVAMPLSLTNLAQLHTNIYMPLTDMSQHSITTINVWEGFKTLQQNIYVTDSPLQNIFYVKDTNIVTQNNRASHLTMQAERLSIFDKNCFDMIYARNSNISTANNSTMCIIYCADSPSINNDSVAFNSNDDSVVLPGVLHNIEPIVQENKITALTYANGALRTADSVNIAAQFANSEIRINVANKLNEMTGVVQNAAFEFEERNSVFMKTNPSGALAIINTHNNSDTFKSYGSKQFSFNTLLAQTAIVPIVGFINKYGVNVDFHNISLTGVESRIMIYSAPVISGGTQIAETDNLKIFKFDQVWTGIGASLLYTFDTTDETFVLHKKRIWRLNENIYICLIIRRVLSEINLNINWTF